MDGFDTLTVRFHFNGEFLKNGKGGTEAMSYVDRDKLSLPEIVGHLCDHCYVKEGTLLHWLFPERDMSTGLRALVDDKVCQYMSDCIVECGVAEVYVEKPVIVQETGSQQDATGKGSDYEDEMQDTAEESAEENEDLQPLIVEGKAKKMK